MRLQLTFIFMVLLFVSGCSKTTKERFTVYSPHGREMLEYFELKFEAAHPTIDVVWLDMGAQTTFDRIRTEKENPQADLWWGAPKELFVKAESLNLLAAYKPTWSVEVMEEFKSKNDFWFATFQTPECIMFNSELLTRKTAPQEWDELLEEKWNQKIIIRDPVQSGTMRTIFAAMIAKEVKRTKSLDSGYAWLARLHKNTKRYAADPSQMFLKLSRGEATVTLWNLTDALLQARQNKFPFDFIIPKSGTIVAIEGIAIVAGAKHPEPAKLFYEFVTNAESMKEQAVKFYRLPTRRDVDIQTDWIKEAQFQTIDLDAAFASQNQEIWMKYWQETIRTK
jgi:iron(III) transport system substrate-binding protein